MPAARSRASVSVPNWVIAIFAILLLVPLFELPRPTLITTPPWKVELLVSLALLLLFLIRPGSTANSQTAPSFFFTGLCLFTAWSGISLIWAPNSGAVVHHTFLWAVYLFFFVATLHLLRSARGVGSALTFSAILTGILGILCVLDFVTVVDFAVSEGTLRIRWAKYAELLVALLPFVWAAALLLRGKQRLVILSTGVLGWVAAMLSLSKAAFISGVIGFAILFVSTIVFSRPNHRRSALKLAAGWIVLTIVFQLGFAYFSSVPATAQYISGSADTTRSTTSMRVFTWSVAGTMIRRSPILGVGADNFGVAFNDARKLYAAGTPGDTNNGIGEDYLFERAHNEYIQIAAELGVIGLLLFAIAFLSLGIWLARGVFKNSGKVSPLLLGSVAGISAFAISSLFTSFSFRADQNGIVFFAMVAVAVYLNSKPHIDQSSERNTLTRTVALAACSGLLLFSLSVGASQIFSTLGEKGSTAEDIKRNFENALIAYPENGSTQLSLASVQAKEGNFHSAAALTRKAIWNGVGASIAYARLSEYAESSEDPTAAIQALEEGIAVFPRSMFLRASLALLLERENLGPQAAKVMEDARAIDREQANGWYALMKIGSKDAYQLSKVNQDVAGPAELMPQNAVYPYLNERMGP